MTDWKRLYTNASIMLAKYQDEIVPGLREQLNRKWIPVTERLPRPFVSVLAFLPGHAPCPTVHECYITADGEWCSAAVYGVEDGDVTHWMPLPEPPKEVER